MHLANANPPMINFPASLAKGLTERTYWGGGKEHILRTLIKLVSKIIFRNESLKMKICSHFLAPTTLWLSICLNITIASIWSHTDSYILCWLSSVCLKGSPFSKIWAWDLSSLKPMQCYTWGCLDLMFGSLIWQDNPLNLMRSAI